MNVARLRLKKNEDRRLRAGHLWVFSNEIDTIQTPLTAFQEGQAVVIEDCRGKALGSGYINPRSLICARLISRNPSQLLDHSFIKARITIALALRQRLYAQPYYRLIYGESDGLPGLVVDRYDDVLVVQITTYGMEAVKTAIVSALDETLTPSAILLRNDSASRTLEGLTSYIEIAKGQIPDAVLLEENGVKFEVSLQTGQKTGWFFDQRSNRRRLWDYVQGKRVLDIFSYVGAWGVQAAMAGASEVICIDSSASALLQVTRNAELNGVQNKMSIRQGDAFDLLAAMHTESDKFDIVIVDPPAFIKRKKDYDAGVAAYQKINKQAMQLLSADGILISASCSHHLPAQDLLQALLRGSRQLSFAMQILEQGHQAPDHPIHPAIAETNYLKAYFARIIATGL